MTKNVEEVLEDEPFVSETQNISQNLGAEDNESYAHTLALSQEIENENEEREESEASEPTSDLPESQSGLGSQPMPNKPARRNPGKSARLNDQEEMEFAAEVEGNAILYNKSLPDFKKYDKKKFFATLIAKYKWKGVSPAQLENFYIHRRTQLSKILNKEK